MIPGSAGAFCLTKDERLGTAGAFNGRLGANGCCGLLAISFVRNEVSITRSMCSLYSAPLESSCGEFHFSLRVRSAEFDLSLRSLLQTEVLMPVFRGEDIEGG